jgi:hypothetical protein
MGFCEICNANRASLLECGHTVHKKCCSRNKCPMCHQTIRTMRCQFCNRTRVKLLPCGHALHKRCLRLNQDHCPYCTLSSVISHSIATYSPSHFEVVHLPDEIIHMHMQQLKPRCSLDRDVNFFEIEKDCPICLEMFTIEDRVRQLTCRHVFHGHCFRTWSICKKECPVCRSHCV